MDLQLAGKVAIVGGGSSGIGYAIARELAGEGASLLIWARRQDALDAAAARIRAETGAQVAAVAADIGKPADNARIVVRVIPKISDLAV